MTERTRQKKRTLSPWIFLALLLVLGVGNLGYLILRFWNLKLDLEEAIILHTNGMGKTFDIPFVRGLSFPNLPENPTALRLEDFDQLFQPIGEASKPGSFSGILQKIPDSERIWAEILSRSRNSLASFPVTIIGTGPYNLDMPEPPIGSLCETASFWTLLCHAKLGRVSSQEVVTALLGVALTAIHTEASGSPYPFFEARFIVLGILDIASSGLLRCSPGLKLSGPETIRAIGFLQAIEKGLLSNQIFTSGQMTRRNAIFERRCSRRPAPFPASLWRWPGKVFTEIYHSPDMVDFRERECSQRYIRLASNPWVATDTEFLRIHKEVGHASMVLRGSTLEIFWRFAFWPKAYFKTWLLSEFPVFMETWRDRDFVTRQWLRMAQWALALSGFRGAKRSWPRAPAELVEWLGITLPTDFFSYGPVLFTPGDPPDIRSIGPDQSPFTEDDILAVASGTASVAAFLDGLTEPAGSSEK